MIQRSILHEKFAQNIELSRLPIMLLFAFSPCKEGIERARRTLIMRNGYRALVYIRTFTPCAT